ncbi:hypothetical protein OAS39_12225 [Pirellulales bacterium]|nr:hypothetical protein [Pirellulales bacterium]
MMDSQEQISEKRLCLVARFGSIHLFVLVFLMLTIGVKGVYADEGESTGDGRRIPLQIGHATQLFVDDYIIHSRSGLERKVQSATKMDRPVLSPEHPWEFSYHPEDDGVGKRIYVYGTVFYDPLQKQYRMWYMSRLAQRHQFKIPELELPGENIHGDLTLYAVSDDGIHWTKPELGLCHFNGSTKNNIMFDFHGASVFLDQQEPDPDKRYKAIGFIRRFHEIRVCYSPDGIHWSEPVHASDRNNEGSLNACYVPSLDCYVAGSIERSTDPLYSFKNFRGDVRGQRVCPALATGSKDLSDWVSRTVIYPHVTDPPNTQFYGMTPFCYGDNGLVFGFLHVFDYTGPGPANDDGPIEAHLIYSRDGRTWNRMEDRQPAIPLGPEGSMDDGMIMMTANGTFSHNDEIITYYTASNTGHGALIKDRDFKIARASWPLDRLVAMTAGQEEGVLETKLLTVPEGKLIVNADAKGGYVTAEVLDAQGQVQPGFSSDKCLAMVEDSLRYNLRWAGKDLAQATQPMQLRFKLSNAELFSFRFVEDN